MAGNKIIEKIEEEARQGAAAIEAEAKQKAEAEKSRILGKAKESAAEIEAKGPGRCQGSGRPSHADC